MEQPRPKLPIPHAEPFLFIEYAEAVYPDEALFRWQFPRKGDSFGLRMFPELLAVEAMAQAAAAFHGLRAQEVAGPSGGPEHGVLASVDRARFNGRARPGDPLTIKVKVKKRFGDLVMLDGEVWVHHRLIAQAELVVRREPSA